MIPQREAVTVLAVTGASLLAALVLWLAGRDAEAASVMTALSVAIILYAVLRAPPPQ